MKYKAGDRVRIKSIDWYNKNIKNNGIIICGSESFTHIMSHFCDKVVTIVTIQDDCYRILEDDGDWYWTDEMIEGLVEEETKNWADTSIPDGPYTVTYGSPSMNDSMNKNNIDNGIIILPDGYIFKDENGNVINATKIVLEKKKKEYPKTYEECCKILGDVTAACWSGYKCGVLGALNKLLICRDAYWKIAGEEMGLGKPWEPDWKNSEERRYCIVNIEGDINLPEKILTKWILKVTNKILVFPTEEMRDAFYENFKELIETVKELL